MAGNFREVLQIYSAYSQRDVIECGIETSLYMHCKSCARTENKASINRVVCVFVM